MMPTSGCVRLPSIPDVKVVGQENAYKEVVKTAVGGAAGVIKAVDSATTDCQPNENVEAMRVFMLAGKIEVRPVWKPMHKQPVYADAPVYTNGVEEEIFRTGLCLPAGPCVSDEDVAYIVQTIKDCIKDNGLLSVFGYDLEIIKLVVFRKMHCRIGVYSFWIA